MLTSCAANKLDDNKNSSVSAFNTTNQFESEIYTDSSIASIENTSHINSDLAVSDFLTSEAGTSITIEPSSEMTDLNNSEFASNSSQKSYSNSCDTPNQQGNNENANFENSTISVSSIELPEKKGYYLSPMHGIPPICWISSVNGMIQWAYDSVIDENFHMEWSLHQKFINYLRTYKKIVVPKIENENFSYYTGNIWEETDDDHKGGYSIAYMSEKGTRLHCMIEPLDANKTFVENIENRLRRFTGCSIKEVKDTCKWGEYFLVTDPSATSAAFEIDGFVVSISVNRNWKTEYFNYFDFETVSLID